MSFFFFRFAPPALETYARNLRSLEDIVELSLVIRRAQGSVSGGVMSGGVMSDEVGVGVGVGGWEARWRKRLEGLGRGWRGF